MLEEVKAWKDSNGVVHDNYDAAVQAEALLKQAKILQDLDIWWHGREPEDLAEALRRAGYMIVEADKYLELAKALTNTQVMVLVARLKEEGAL